jgi:hypothetical protein
MPLYGDTLPTVWIRALRDHTYEGRSVPAGTIYLAHEHIVETIESTGLGRREPAPMRATRTTPKP